MGKLTRTVMEDALRNARQGKHTLREKVKDMGTRLGQVHRKLEAETAERQKGLDALQEIYGMLPPEAPKHPSVWKVPESVEWLVRRYKEQRRLLYDVNRFGTKDMRHGIDAALIGYKPEEETT